MTKVLLVEDDPFMWRMYVRVFVHEGLEAEVAEDGQAGLEKLKTFHPDIILLDIMMPKMNGIEMLTRVKSDPTTRDIPVVMLTNLADVYMAEIAIKQGAVHYIVKSKYSPLDMVAMLEQFTGGKPKETVKQ